MDCPICFDHFDDLVAGPCGHGLCLNCADKLLLKGRRRGAAEVVPTVGQCPLCREELLYFDLISKTSLEKAFPEDEIDEHLYDAVYVGEMGVGWTSLHFLEGGDINKSYIQGQDNLQMKLVNLRYHRRSQTMAFQFRRPEEHDGGKMGIVSFSDNFSFIARGVLRHQNAIRPSRIDGVWKRPGIGSDVIVFNNQCLVVGGDGEEAHCLGALQCHGDSISILIRPQDDTTEEEQTWDACIQLDQNESLPASRILRWKHSETVVEVWIFDRMLPSESSSSIPISGQNGELYWRLGLSEPPTPEYHANGLEGNVFVQLGEMGIASYHFDSDQSYISYEHSYAASKWPPLDNGRPIPARMHFTNIQKDATRFRGEIDWIGTYGTTWNGARRWFYDIHFDDRFYCVVGGTVRYEQDTDGPGQSEFGKDLIYTNAALLSNEACWAELDFRQLQRCGATSQTIAGLLELSRKPKRTPSYFM